MIKGLISNVNIYRGYGINYQGYLYFQIGDENFHSNEINTLIKDLTLNSSIKYKFYLEALKGLEFKVHSRYTKGNGGYVYEIEIISNFLNPNKIKSYLESDLII